MASEALQNESSSLEPSIKRVLFAKEKVRKRYLDWMTIIDNPKELEAVKNAYIEAITSTGNSPNIESLSPLMALSLLDRQLNEALNYASFEQLIHIRNTYGADLSCDGFNHIGYKQLKWLEATREVLQDVVAFAGWRGELLLTIRSLSKELLPGKWNSDVQTKLNYAYLDKDSLKPLLTDYLLREDNDIGNQQLQTLQKENVVSEPFFYDDNVVYSHIKSCIKSDPQKALELMSKPMEQFDKYSIFLRVSQEFVKNGHLEEFMERVNSLKEDRQWSIFQKIGPTLVESGHLNKALSLTNQINKVQMRYDSLIGISCSLLKRGNVEEAVNICQIVPWDHLKYHLDYMVRDILEGPIDNTTKFVSSMAQEFYNEQSHLTFSVSLYKVISKLMESGKYDEAVNFALSIPADELEKKRFLNHIDQYER